MYCLTEQQVTRVYYDVEKAGINFSHLSTDLVDHICCDIESQMQEGISFEKAYKVIQEEFGIKGLRQIQQDTLMLIDKNYRIMKKSMKTIGMLALALMAFGALFKIMHLPGASVMLTLSFFFTTFVFFPSLLYVTYKEVNKKQQALLFISAFLGGAAFTTGVLFKLMHWPGAAILLFGGLCLLTFLVIPIILISRLKSAQSKRSVIWMGFISLMVLITGLMLKLLHLPGAAILLALGSIFLILIAVPMFYRAEIRNSTKPRLDFIFAIIALTYFIVLTFMMQMSTSGRTPYSHELQQTSFEKSAAFLFDQNVQWVNSTDNTQLRKLFDESKILSDKIDGIKIAIIQEINQVERDQARQILISGKMLAEADRQVAFLLPGNKYYSSMSMLKSEVNKFINLYTAITDTLPKAIKLNGIFDADSGNSTDQWEIRQIQDQTASSILTRFSFWQYQVQLAQNYLFTNVNSNVKIQ